MITLRGWRLVQKEPPILDINGQIIVLAPRYFDTLFDEWLSWKSIYLPPNGVAGMKILDVGAGCGETALFFFFHGARKVICVEPDAENMERLKENASRNKWNVETHLGEFDLEMLNWDFDFLKMDCEGCERELLRLDSVPPCSIEVHDAQTHQRLVGKFHLKTVANDRRGTWLVRSS